MLTVVCVKHGTKYGPEYVNRLYAMVARNLEQGLPGKFICYTDDADGLFPEIIIRELPDGLKGWWGKLYLFSPGQFVDGERVFFFDLDTLVIDSLDQILSYSGEFAILRDFYRPNGWGSCAMAWRGGFGAHIWQSWNDAGRPEMPMTLTEDGATRNGGDQAWIEKVQPTADLWQDLFPGQFVSFKVHCNPYPPEGARVVAFHGDPKPDDCGRKWVEAIWHEGSLGGVSLALEGNTPLNVIHAQSKASGALGLPHIKTMPAHGGQVLIVGGGPSLRATVSEVAARQRVGAKVWALNGAYGWLIDRGVIPDAMVLLDARQDNVGFITSVHPETTYYLASQCHPDVYDAVIDRKVVRFDLDKVGDCGTTVGTHAMCLAFVEGYRDVHLYGFDSSYSDAEGHAYRQEMNGRDKIIDVQVGDRSFKAAPWMAQQARDFESLARDLAAAGCVLTVHGDGLIPYVAHLMATPPLTTAQIRAEEVLKRLNGTTHPVGAEVGVFAGEMSAHLLARDGLSLIMVDSWEGGGRAYSATSDDWHETLSQPQQDTYRTKATHAVRFAGDRARIARKRSVEAAADVSDGSLDFVFLDADHSYEGVRADISAWLPKLKAGAVLGGHDYANDAFPQFGVKRAVDEFAAIFGLPVDLGDNFTWFITVPTEA